MNWYKISKLSGKTKRHDKSAITLYHVSPNRLSQISGRSNFYNMAGAYLSQSYKSIINDWMFYVRDKKHENHELENQRQSLVKELYDLGDKERTPEEDKKMKCIQEKYDKISDATDRDEYIKSVEGYKTIYIHKVACPRPIYEIAEKLYNEAKQSEWGSKKSDFGFWAWGEQIFIPERYLPELKIIGVEELNVSQMLNRFKDLSSRRYMQ